MIRAKIVSDLFKGIYGPEGGVDEVLTESPLKKYITGILSPELPSDVRDPDQEQEIIPQESKEYESHIVTIDNIPDYIHASPSLNPKHRPRSMGISFNVVSSKFPFIKICATWGKYHYADETWSRNALGYISDDVECNPSSNKQILLDKEGNPCSSDDCAASILITTWKVDEKSHFINVFFTNRLKVENRRYATSEEYIFQPQLRINVITGKLSTLNKTLSKKLEDREIEYLFRYYEVPARGHMCSAIWKDADPERNYVEDIKDSLFYWVDYDAIIDYPHNTEFISPDLRTEFIPSFNIESPIYDWPNQNNKPVFHPNELSQLWDPEEVELALAPFIDEYKKWINSIDEEKCDDYEIDIIRNLKNNNYKILKRIEKSINLLKVDENVRLAFCFANKVISIQNIWKGEDFPWRPFQLAFILYTLESVANKKSEERDVCDLLVVPTGAGKTEAYLGLAAFSIAYRRRIAIINNENEDGCEVIMRYTLRLLTIQQYRRALLMITACEYLRVYGIVDNNPIGWRPLKCTSSDNFIWGTSRFSIGLWVGGKVSPNRLSSGQTQSGTYLGAIDLLLKDNQTGEGEPAQILECPACNTILSIPNSGLKTHSERFHIIIKIDGTINNIEKIFEKDLGQRLNVTSYSLTSHNNAHYTLNLQVATDLDKILPKDFDDLIMKIIDESYKHGVKISLIPARASRPGYFLKYNENSRGVVIPYDFEIYCPKPECPLHNEKGIWIETVPYSKNHKKNVSINERINRSYNDKEFISPLPFTTIGDLSKKIPIPAYTVDEQVYNKCPTFIVATVDKIARLPYEPRTASMFGNVSHYNPQWGYYREGAPTLSYKGTGKHPTADKKQRIKVSPLGPPNLIIQDELHLLEGPLGSMVGIYESLVDYLCSRENLVKYIASTATVKGASDQIKSLFARRLSKFPNPISEITDRFFIKYRSNVHQLSENKPGRLYLGICSPGWGTLTPVYRVWARLMQSAFENASEYSAEITDFFWTLVGYFNSIRELAGARNMYRQDIPGNIQKLSDQATRTIPDDRVIELSSRKDSTELPSILNEIAHSYSGNPDSPGTPDAIFTTSMFGTGVDISRLSMMIMHGQPKTTSNYIQSTGRVGRKKGGLVVTIYSPSKPRDLNHYEMFCGYHSKMDMFVEPITVAPFAPGTLTRCLGPVIVGALRTKLNPSHPWHLEETAIDMKDYANTTEIKSLKDIFIKHLEKQPEMRKISTSELDRVFISEVDKWESKSEKIANKGEKIKYVEYTSTISNVVLGDPKHKHKGLIRVYENAPNSLRDIEETTGFQIRERR